MKKLIQDSAGYRVYAQVNQLEPKYGGSIHILFTTEQTNSTRPYEETRAFEMFLEQNSVDILKELIDNCSIDTRKETNE